MNPKQCYNLTRAIVSYLSGWSFFILHLIVLMVVLPGFLVSCTQTQTSEWSFQLTNPSQESAPNSTVVYNGVITNSTGGDLLLDDMKFRLVTNAPDSSLTQDFSDEFLRTLGVIPTSGYKGPIFVINWLPSAPVGATAVLTITLSTQAAREPSSISQTADVAVVAP